MGAYVQRNNNILFKKIGNEIAIVSSDNKRLYILNDVSAFIWQMTDKEKDIATIKEAIISEYDTSDYNVEKDLQDFLNAVQNSYQELFTISRKPSQ
jgi:hypothetical protein